MTELKTLKDLDWEQAEWWDEDGEGNIESGFDESGCIGILKQEAIKWIKEIESNNLIDKNCKTCMENKTKMIHQSDGIPIIFDESEQQLLIEWIQHFFNITNEDLK